MVPRSQTLPSPPTPAFTGSRLDRGAKLRASPSQLEALLADLGARAVFARGDEILLSAGGHELLRAPLSELAPLSGLGVRQAGAAEGNERWPILLGLQDDRPLFGVDLEWLQETIAAEVITTGELESLREAGAWLPAPESGLGAYLVALTNWHRHHRFCANCGAETRVAQAGLTRDCPRCGRTHFPRTDPVVIMLVESEGRLLLGRRPIWPKGRYSLLAGFISPGETPEEAVAREVREESGIEVRTPHYLNSQPWPFPASLMLGYWVSSPGGDPYCADGELQDVGWFSREEVQAASASASDWSASVDVGTGKGLLLPPPVSIARTLIEWWLATPDRPE